MLLEIRATATPGQSDGALKEDIKGFLEIH